MSRIALPNVEVAAPARQTGIGRFVQRYGWSYVFIAPSMLVFTVFILLPAISSLIRFFTRCMASGVNAGISTSL